MQLTLLEQHDSTGHYLKGVEQQHVLINRPRRSSTPWPRPTTTAYSSSWQRSSSLVLAYIHLSLDFAPEKGRQHVESEAHVLYGLDRRLWPSLDADTDEQGEVYRRWAARPSNGRLRLLARSQREATIIVANTSFVGPYGQSYTYPLTDRVVFHAIRCLRPPSARPTRKTATAIAWKHFYSAMLAPFLLWPCVRRESEFYQNG